MHRMHSRLIVVCLAVLLCSVYPAVGATAPPLGAAASFSVLGSSTVTNTGPTVVTGDLGVSAGSAVTGFPPGSVVGGSIHAADVLAAQAQNAAITAYNNLAAQPCTTTFGVPTDLGGIDSNPRRVLFCVVGRGDGTTSTGRVGKPECGLRLQDREHVRLSKRRVYFDDQRRFELQCFLAGHQLRDAGYDQYRAGNHHRADKCHPEDRRSPLRQSHCANRCGDAR